MKFAVAAVVTLALAMGVQSSLYPLGPLNIAGNGLSYTAVSGSGLYPSLAPIAQWGQVSPWGLGPGSVAIQAGLPQLQVPASVAIQASPLALGHHAGIVVPHAYEGTYIAKTRGAVHTAPLSGHINSAAAINVAPAPGTI